MEPNTLLRTYCGRRMRFRNSSFRQFDSERRVKDNAPYHGIREVVPVARVLRRQDTIATHGFGPTTFLFWEFRSDPFSQFEKANVKDQS